MTDAVATIIASGGAIMVAVFGFAWRLAGRLTHIEDGVDLALTKLDELPCHDCPIIEHFPAPRRHTR
jgi:hypothetical protein